MGKNLVATSTGCPVSWMNWEAEGEYQRVWKQEAWVANREEPGRIVSLFGDRKTDALDLTLRATMTFARDLTLQLYAQTFLARGHYEHFRRLEATGLFQSASYDGSPDFNEKVLNANAVLRWEYLPGSTLYLVWSHARSGSTDDYFTPLGTSLRETFRLPAANVLMVKASYWFNP